MNQQVGTINLKVGVDAEAVSSFLTYIQGQCSRGHIDDATAHHVTSMVQRLAVVTASPDANVERNRQMLLDRSVVGLKKYGVTTEREDLNLGQWVQHALEEVLDLANYLQAAKTQIECDAQLVREAFEEGFRMSGELDPNSPNGCAWRSAEEAWLNSDARERLTK